VQRSITQPARPGQAAGRTTTGTSPGGFFSRPGFLGGLAAGFLGAGLLGMLFGHGLGGGLGGFASILGLVLQIGLVLLVARLIWGWWQRRNQPAYAAPSGSGRYSFEPNQFAGAGSTAAMGAADAGDITIEPADYDAFERLLMDVQEAYSKEDMEALRRRVTPEMLGYFADDLADNASRGLVNRISDVKLLSGDLSEAWSEGDAEYAAVAMRFSLVDTMVERDSGRIVDGNPGETVEATEIWTFRRVRGGQWLLSAVQQA
jgi:predicted lipid-binding transport protein (Tim44 family)